MIEPRSNRARRMIWTLHRWIGVGLALLLVPIAVSGGLLVYTQQIDALVHPGRYAVSGPKVALQPSAYLERAVAAVDSGFQPSIIRFGDEDGGPVTVLARGTRAEGGPVRLLVVYLDPPTGRVLEVVDYRSSLMGILHRFHENLTIPEYSGRQIVGWVGTGMLILSVSGIYLWWPRGGGFLVGLRWRRANAPTANLHHMFGFWISIPLAVISLTGIYLAFPPQARSLMSTIAPMNPQPQRGFGPVLRNTALNPDSARNAALGSEPESRVLEMALPPAPRDSGARGGDMPPFWRIQLRKVDGSIVTRLVNDRDGAVTAAPDALAGDRAAQWVRWIHEGSHSGAVWRAIVFLTGMLPALLGVTGIVMWLRGRQRKAARNGVAASGTLQAAE